MFVFPRVSYGGSVRVRRPWTLTHAVAPLRAMIGRAYIQAWCLHALQEAQGASLSPTAVLLMHATDGRMRLLWHGPWLMSLGGLMSVYGGATDEVRVPA